MLDLISKYSLSDIFIFTIILALALKSLIKFCNDGYLFFRKVLNKQYDKLTEKQKLQKRLQQGSHIMQSLTQNQKRTDQILQNLVAKIDMLIQSDKDDIKSYITREHHYFCYKKGWIDDFSLDCIQKRYKHYEDEGGNSFIQALMKEIRALPRHPLEPPQ